ncbi:MAG TPA: hypothetical protein VF332_01770 [Vicinamibacterales bacterium]
MDPFRTPLVECFMHGDVPRDVRLMGARGGLALPAQEQLSLLMLLVSDPDPEVGAIAEATIGRLPSAPLAAFLASPDVPPRVRAFFANYEARPGRPEPPDAPPPADPGAAEVTPACDTPADIEADPDRRGTAQRLSMLTVAERIKVAMQGNREERMVLVRDPNRLVSSAVLSSPRLTDSEVEAIARMTNVSDDVLRVVGTNRVWTKSYPVVASLTRNAKTPIGIALTLLNRLTERDVKMLSTDRNIPEPVRLAARKIYTQGVARRHS